MNLLSRGRLNLWALCLAVVAPAPLWDARAAAQDQLEAPPCGANADGVNELGLYVSSEDCADPEIDPQLKRYRPQYELWSDGADKERFILLPQAGAEPTEAEKIDAANPDHWKFPPGTVLYKTFKRSGRRIETRKIYFDDGAETPEWKFEAYAWSEDQRTTVKHEGGPAPIDPTHYIPNNNECFECHQQWMPRGVDPVLGFSALQLNHSASETTLASLGNFLKNSATPGASSEGSASELQSLIERARVPAEKGSVAEQALGYLHGNCSNCHGDPASGYPELKLWVPIGIESVAAAPVSTTGVCQCVDTFRNKTIPGTVPAKTYTRRIVPGNVTESAVFARMSAAGVFGGRSPIRMPPIATVDPHPVGIDLVSAWITSLEGVSCDEVCP